MKPKICENCKWYGRELITTEIDYTKIPIETYYCSGCSRFPEWIRVKEDHFCGEYKHNTQTSKGKGKINE